MEEILIEIVQSPNLHTKWLNSLSYMENSGARKIIKSEDRRAVSLLILKHAAEEARHAYFLKKQIQKIDVNACQDYSPGNLLVPSFTYRYLDVLDLNVVKFLRTEFVGASVKEVKYMAYLLVTYAIELRADSLYPLYQKVLTDQHNVVNVKSIIAEETGHLEEMSEHLNRYFQKPDEFTSHACVVENNLFNQWRQELGAAILQPKTAESVHPD